MLGHILHGQSVAKKIEIEESPLGMDRPNLSAIGFFILIAVVIGAALFGLVPDAWWGLGLR